MRTSTFKSVYVNTSFVACHRWADAPPEVKYLRDYHRHKFGVYLNVGVTHNERQIEFHTLLKQLNEHIQLQYHNTYSCNSCETFATLIVAKFRQLYPNRDIKCQVDEDGENGAVEYYVFQETFQEESPNQESFCSTPEAHEEQLIASGTEQKPATECFVGTEAEGPPEMRGKGTLFVPGSTTPQEFYKAAATAFSKWRYSSKVGTEKLSRCYYGAGNDRAIRQDTLDAILTVFSPDELCIEVTTDTPFSLQQLKDLEIAGATIVQISNNPGKCKHYYFNWKKIKSDYAVTWHSRCSTAIHVTRLNDPLFAQDVKVPSL